MIDSESGLDCRKSQVQHEGKLLNSLAPVFLFSSMAAWSLDFFCIRASLLGGRFPLFHCFCDLIDLANHKGIVPICGINQLFYFFSGFPGPVECG